MPSPIEHCGYASLVGRPNVGKSSLLNRLIGQKLSITSRKPQTTRSHLLGIKTAGNSQIIYIDTPGLQKKAESLFNRHMNREVHNSLSQTDVVVHVVEAMKWNEGDALVHETIKNLKCTKLLAINKMDRVSDRKELLPFIKRMHDLGGYDDIVPVSARHGTNIDSLEGLILKHLPASPAVFPEDQLTDRNERYFAAEFLREKLMRSLGDELPYNITVTIDKFSDEKRLVRIYATIWVASHGQKKIVVGKDGAVLKKAGQEARRDIENMFGKKVFLQTWVKVKDQWMANARAMKIFGYEA